MYFNRYVFDCYLQTDSARETKNFFENLSVWVKEEKWKEIYSYLFKQGYTQESEGYWIETFVFIQDLLANFSDWERAENIEQAIEEFEGFVDSFLAESDKKECRDKLAWLDGISLFLYLKDPEHYIPYFLLTGFSCWKEFSSHLIYLFQCRQVNRNTMIVSFTMEIYAERYTNFGKNIH